MELTAGCHFTREEADKLQKGLRFKFLESHGLIEGCSIAGSIRKEKSPELARRDRCGVGGQFTMWKAVLAVAHVLHLFLKLHRGPRVTCGQVVSLKQ